MQLAQSSYGLELLHAEVFSSNKNVGISHNFKTLKYILWAVVIHVIGHSWWRFEVSTICSFWDNYPKILKFSLELWAVKNLNHLDTKLAASQNFYVSLSLVLEIFSIFKKLFLAFYQTLGIVQSEPTMTKGLSSSSLSIQQTFRCHNCCCSWGINP